MVNYSCCVPNCSNNWRNSPNLKFHALPSDEKVKKEYKRLIRNTNLREDAQSTRICGAHFPGGERMSRTQLPSIFPWTPAVPVMKRRVIEKHDLPVKAKRRLVLVMNSNENSANGELETDEPPIDTDGTDIEQSEDPTSAGSVALGSENKEICEVKSDDNMEEIKRLTEEVNSLRSELLRMKHAMELDNKKPKFAIEDHKNSDSDISFYTGLPNYDTLLFCFDLLKEKAVNLSYNGKVREHVAPESKKPGPNRKLTTWQEFTMVLLRLRLGLFERDLAERFRVSVSTVSSVCRTWIKFMKKELEPVCIQWPSKEQIVYNMPPVFKSHYPDLVSVIDCTEIQMESPSSLDKRSLCYSSYKSRTTMKALIGITPNGVVSFCSDLYCGSVSDPEIVRKSGYLTHLHKGDLVMADKGFTIQDELASVGARLTIPHFLRKKTQFTKQESENNKKIASLRIHVERYMERLKNWHFFDRPVPITLSDIASDAWTVVACLSNFLPPIVS